MSTPMTRAIPNTIAIRTPVDKKTTSMNAIIIIITIIIII